VNGCITTKASASTGVISFANRLQSKYGQQAQNKIQNESKANEPQSMVPAYQRPTESSTDKAATKF